MVVIVLVATMFMALGKSCRGIPPKSLTVKELVEGPSKVALIDWVYNKSNRISRKTFTEIVGEAMKYQKPLLLLSIMEVESNFIPTANSPKNALGLMQVMPGVWDKDLIAKGIIKERRDLYDIEPAVKAGNYVFGICLMQAKGDVEKAMEYYLGGKDGAYTKRILANLATLYLLTDVRLN
jgi:soluble lytic murein transglycosylase-like protein